jgi:two-component system NtrC family sensor kinase
MVDLHEGIENALTLLQPHIGEEISLVREYADLSPIYGSPGQLNQVFMHLLKNAVRAIEGRGEIRIRTFQDDAQMHVQIGDTGMGIPPEQLEHIFDLGRIKEGSRMAMKFGLAIDYSIVQDHQGTIQIESEVGSGTMVTVSLPRRA